MIHAGDDSSLDAPGDRLLADLMDDIQRRLHAGQRVELEPILDAHPEHAAEIRRLYETIDTMSRGIEHRRHGSERGLDELPPPAVLGDYRILREVGRGGMGIVYEAEQLSLNRRVALKVLPFAAMFDERQRQRFRNEAAAAASLHHENIVPVYGMGCQTNVHFYAMQFVDGRTASHLIHTMRAGRAPALPPHGDRTPRHAAGSTAATTTATAAHVSTHPGTAGRGIPFGKEHSYFRFIARIGFQIAQALDYAHQHGIIHRDVKPSNLMIDEAGKVWVTDFGLARFDHQSHLTVSGDLVGTLRYMSPEQTRSGRLVDHRTDVYSLGVTLYELLTLAPAFPAEDRAELLEQIRASAPVAPRRQQPQLPRDLETITLKAIAGDPEDRYQSAGSMAGDLKCFLDDQPIVARRPTLAGRLSRWTKRHSFGVSLGLIAVALLAVAASGAAVWIGGLYQRADRMAVRAERERIEAARIASRWHAERAARRLEAGDPAGLWQLVAAMKMSAGLAEYDDLARVWALWHAQFEGQLRCVVGHDGPVHDVALHPDGHLLASASHDTLVKLWHVPSGHAVHRPLAAPSAVVGVEFSNDGGLLAAGLSNGGVVVWNADHDFELVHSFEHGHGAVRKLEFNSDASVLATASEGDSYLRLWNLRTGQPRAPPIRQKEDQYDLAFSPDASLLAMGNSASRFAVWRMGHTPRRYASPEHLHSVRFVRFLGDRHNLLTASLDRIVRRWRITETAVCEQSFQCDGVISQVAVHHASPLAAVGTVHGALSLWNCKSGERREMEKLHRTHIDALAFSDDGRLLASGCRDGTGRIFDVESGRAIGPKIRHEAGITDVVFARDDELMITASRDGTVRYWDADYRGPVSVLAEGAGSTDVRFSRDGALLGAVAGNEVCLWRAVGEHWEPIGSVHEDDEIAQFAFHPASAILATATSAQLVRFWNISTKQEAGPPLRFGDWVRSVAFSADGTRLAVGTGAHQRTVWLYTGTAEHYQREAAVSCLSGVAALAFSRREAVLAAGTHHGLEIVDLASAGLASRRIVSERSVASVSCHPSGDRFALGLRRPVAVIVDAEGRIQGAPLRHPGRVSAVAYSPDGTSLVTSSRDAEARVWYGLDSAHRYCVCLRHPGPVRHVAYHPGGRAIATSCADGRVRIWAVPARPPSLQQAIAATERTVAARMAGDERTEALDWRQWQAQ